MDGGARQELLQEAGLQQTGSLRFYSGGTLRAYFPLYEGEGRLYLSGWDEQGYQIRWPLPEDSGGELEQLLARAELPGGIPCPAAEELQAALVRLRPEDAALRLDAEDFPALCEALRQCRETAAYAQQLPDALRYDHVRRARIELQSAQGSLTLDYYPHDGGSFLLVGVPEEGFDRPCWRLPPDGDPLAALGFWTD